MEEYLQLLTSNAYMVYLYIIIISIISYIITRLFIVKLLTYLFNKKGWERVVGFHTRNIPHRAHEYIQLEALNNSHADGLFISPVIGEKKINDFSGEIILKSYQYLIDAEVYPKGKILLTAFKTFSRYSGPREAVFTAICRKNYGCNYFMRRQRYPFKRRNN